MGNHSAGGSPHLSKEDTMGYYSHPHTATDFTTMKVNPDLAVLGNCYPGDFDGFVSRRGVMGHPIRFLLIKI